MIFTHVWNEQKNMVFFVFDSLTTSSTIGIYCIALVPCSVAIKRNINYHDRIANDKMLSSITAWTIILGRDGYHMSVFPAGTPLLFLYFTNNICLISVKDYFPWEDVVHNTHSSTYLKIVEGRRSHWLLCLRQKLKLE